MVEIDKELIAKKIKMARKRLGLRQEDLAKELGISTNHICRIEQAVYVPSLQTFLKMVEVLKLDLIDFGVKSPENKNPLVEEILKIINTSSDKELEFYLKCLKTLSENFNLIK